MASPLLVDDYLGTGGGGRDVDVWNTSVAVFFVAFSLWGFRLLVRATKLSDVSFGLQSGNVVNTRGHRLRVPALRTLTLRHTRHVLRGAHDVRPVPVRNLRAPFAVDRASFRAVPEQAIAPGADAAGAADDGADGHAFPVEGTVLSTDPALVAVMPLPASCSSRYTFAGTAPQHAAIARHARRMFRLATRAADDNAPESAYPGGGDGDSGAGEAEEEEEAFRPCLTHAAAHPLSEGGTGAGDAATRHSSGREAGAASVDLAPSIGAGDPLAASLPRGAARLSFTLQAPPPRRRRRAEVGYAVGIMVCGDRSLGAGAGVGTGQRDSGDVCAAAFAVVTLCAGETVRVDRFVLAPDPRARGPPHRALRLLRAEPAFGLGAGEHRGECVVCLCEPRAVVLLPCRHLAVCGDCLPHLDKCPCCRAPFDGYLMPRDVPAEAPSPQ